MLIDVDNVNQAESHKWVCHILKNTYDTCFIDWEWSQISLEKLFPLVVFVDVNGVDHEAKSGSNLF